MAKQVKETTSQPSAGTIVGTITARDQELIRTTTDEACLLAETIKVTSPALYIEAGDALKRIKTAQAVVDSTQAGIVNPIKAGLKSLKEFFAGPEARLARAENLLKAQIAAYDQEQEQKRREEQAKKDEEARRERERLAALAKAAEEAAERERAAGNLAKAEKLEAKAAMRTDQANMVVAPTVQSTVPIITGISKRANWSAVVTNLEDLVLAVASTILTKRAAASDPVPAWACKGSAPLEAIQANQTFLNAQAKAFKKKGELYPGVSGVVGSVIAAGKE